MPSLQALSNNIKNAISSLLPMSWYVTPMLGNDIEKGELLVSDELEIFQIRQAHGYLNKESGSPALSLCYQYHGKAKNIQVANESLLDDVLSELTEINQWIITNECGETRYKYRDKYDAIKTVKTRSELDLHTAGSLPSSYNAWVIHDVTDTTLNKTYVLKKYNWFWSVVDTKRYNEADSKTFLNDLLLTEKSWLKTKLLLGTSLTTAVVGASAYAAYRVIQNNSEVLTSPAMDVLGSGNEFRANTYTIGDQSASSLAVLANGDFVVVWMSNLQDVSNYGIYGQHYNSNGLLQGSEFKINSYTTNGQYNPVIASLTGGGFVVAWYGEGAGDSYGVFAQNYDNNCAMVGSEFLVNTYTLSTEYSPAIGSLSNGGFVIVWSGLNMDIFGQRFDSNANPQGLEFQVSTNPLMNIYYSPTVAGLTTGGFIVVWPGYFPGDNNDDIYAQRYDNAGVALGSEFRVNTNTINTQYSPSIAGLTNGDFVVAWNDINGVLAQRYNNAGTALGNEFNVNAYTLGGAYDPSVSDLKNGDFAVMWTSSGRDGDSGGVFGQRFDTNGAAKGSEFRANNYTTNNQFSPAVAGIVGDVFVVVWTSSLQDGSSDGIYGNIFQVNDAPTLGNNNLVINEGAVKLLTNSDLSATDDITAAGALIFTVSNIQRGQFELVSNSTFAITSFTQQQITNTDVQFVHDGGEFAPSYEVSVLDDVFSTTPASASISFTNVNDVPVLENNRLILNTGESIELTGSDLSASDAETNSALLTFAISNVQQGQFELISSPGIAIYSFTQQQITNNAIQFVHNNSAITPSYDVSVSDGVLSSTPTGASVTFNAPDLVQNNLTINEGQSVVLTSLNLNATDVDTAYPDLIFVVNNALQGQFELVSNLGVAINSFIQQQITDSEVQFVHDGGEIAPSYAISVSDNTTIIAPEFAMVTFLNNVNDPPVLNDNNLIIHQGETKTVTVLNLGATDTDNAPNSIIFTINTVQQGQFEISTAPGLAITTFTQEQINNNQVWFSHDGGLIAPNYQVSVSDGVTSIGPDSVNLKFVLTPHDFLVNTYTTSNQQRPSVAALPNGDFVVTWTSDLQDGSGSGIYAQRYNSGGNAQGAEFQVNTFTTNSQTSSLVTGLNNGGFVIAWTSYLQDGSSYGVYAQRYDSNSAASGVEFRVNTSTSQEQRVNSISGLTSGGFVVTWESAQNSAAVWDIYAQRYDNNGTPQGSEFRVNTYTTSSQQRSSVASLSDGGFVVTWGSTATGINYGINGQRYDVNGVALGAEFRVNTYTAYAQFGCSVAGFASGGFLVSWQGTHYASGIQHIYGQHYDSNAVKVGSEFQVNTYAFNGQGESSIAVLIDDSFVITWSGNGFSDDSGVYGRRYDSAGIPLDSCDFLINNNTEGYQSYASVAELTNGNFVAVWYSSFNLIVDVFAKVFDSAPGATFPILPTIASPGLPIVDPGAPTVISPMDDRIAITGLSFHVDIIPSTIFTDPNQDIITSAVTLGPSSTNEWLTTSLNLVPKSNFNSLTGQIGLSVAGSFVYAAVNGDSLTIFNLADSSTFNLPARYATPGCSYDLVVVGNYLYIADGKMGLTIVNVSDPSNPSLSAQIIDPVGSALSIAVDNGYAYVLDDTKLQIIDVITPEIPALKGNYPTSQFALKVAVDGNYAYVLEQYKLEIINFSNPDNPFIVGTYIPVNQFNSFRDIAVAGEYVYLVEPELLSIIKVSNPSSPSLLSSYTTAASGGAFASVTVLGKYAYVVDGILQVIDITNPILPVLKATYGDAGSAYEGAVVGDYIYLAGGSSGLQILEMAVSLDGTPASTAIGSRTITISADDGKGGITETAFKIKVRPPNEQLIVLGGALLLATSGAAAIALIYRSRSKIQQGLQSTNAKLLNAPIYKLSTIQGQELTLDKKLGQGGFGIVYSGTWVVSAVAIKQLFLSQMSSNLVNDFLNEVEIMAALTHPNITKILGVSVKDENVLLVMELMNGSLDKLLYSNIQIDRVTQARLAFEIAAGLQYLHGQTNPILHRDIKSMNVLLDKKSHAKLTDFGFAKVKAEMPKGSDQAASKEASGTLPWMAPELFEKNAKYTAAADIYSFGMLLWELVARRIPFQDANTRQVLKLWKQKGKVEILPADCPEALANLIRACWERDPKKRPTIASIKQDLKVYLNEVVAKQKSAPPTTFLPAISTDILPLSTTVPAEMPLHELKGNYDSLLLSTEGKQGDSAPTQQHELKQNYESSFVSTTSNMESPRKPSVAQSPYGIFNTRQETQSPRLFSAVANLLTDLQAQFSPCWETTVTLKYLQQEARLEFAPNTNLTEELLEDFAEQLKASSDAISQKDFAIQNCDVSDNTVILTMTSSVEAMSFINLLQMKSGLQITSAENSPTEPAVPFFSG